MPPISGSQKAPLYALLGVARIGAFRLGYVSPQSFVRVNGTIVDGLIDDVTIHEALDESTTAEMSVLWDPTEGHEVIITLGSINAGTPRFAGVIRQTTQIYLHEPDSVAHKLSLIDHTWGLNQLKVSGHFTGSATEIAREIIAAGAPGYTSLGVDEGLATVEGGMTVTFQDTTDALHQLCDRLGLRWRQRYPRDVRLYLPPDTSVSPPQDVTEANPTLMVEPKVGIASDISPFISRVLHEGGGSVALTTVAVGETILPVEDLSWYQTAGGNVVSGPQRIPYTGIRSGNVGPGAGALVGPSAAPVVAPFANRTAGSGVDAGVHDWAYVWVTAAGKTLPSPIVKATMKTFVTPGAPTVADGLAVGPLQGPTAGRSVQYALVVQSYDDTAGTPIGTASTAYIALGSHWPAITFTLTADMVSPLAPAELTTIIVVKNEDSAGWIESSRFSTTAAQNPAGTVITSYDQMSSATYDTLVGISTFTPAASAVAQRANLGIQNGPSGVTSKEIYRTVAGGSQLKLLTTIANNTTTTFADLTADASLGANAPTTDTSGLSTVSGNVLAGSTTLLVASSLPFYTGGGWARAGDQVIRYTGISGNTLTGIPASGVGAILTTLPYGTPIIPAHELIGIAASGTGAILYAIPGGQDVNLLAQIDDESARVALAALLTTATYTHTGIIEAYLQDRRLSYEEAYARGKAHLLARNQVNVTIQFATTDQNMRPGQTVTINLGAPTSLTGDFIVHSVDWTFTQAWPAQAPIGTVTASSTVFSFDDLIRLAASNIT